MLNSANLKAQDFIQEIPESRAKLTQKSVGRIDKLKKNENIISIKFIEFGDLKKNQVNGIAKFKLPGINEELELITIRMEYKSDTEYSWYATTKDGIGSVIILRKGSSYTGHFSLGNKREFQIVNEDGQHILLKMKTRRNGTEYCGAKLTQKEKNNNVIPKDASNSRIEACWDPIRVLVLWTQNAENTGINTNNVINTAIGQFNSSIYRSNITSAAAITLVGSQRIDFTESNNINTDWNSLSSNGVVQNLRNNSNADIVILLTNGSYGTITGTVGNFSMNQNSAFAIVKIGNAVDDTKTFAHEVGHLFDARHENDNSGQSYARAHTIDFAWPTSNCYTVMIASEIDNVVENFSNPNVSLSGLATGTNENNNARRVSETWQAVRNHRPSGNNLSCYISGQNYCNVYNSYTWESVVGICNQQSALSYEWFTSIDGFNWNLRGTDEFYSEYVPWYGTNYYFMRLRVTYNGQVSESFSTIYINYDNQGGRIAASDNKYSENLLAPIIWGKQKQEDEFNTVKLGIEKIFPNPSQSAFALSFVNPMEQDISLDLIDATGHTVNLFSKEHFQKGKYSKTFDVNYLSSGTYVVKLSSDIESATTKLIFTK